MKEDNKPGAEIPESGATPPTANPGKGDQKPEGSDRLQELEQRTTQLEAANRGLSDERNTLRNQLRELERKGADPDALKASYDAEKAEWVKEREALATKLRQVTVEKEVKSDLAEKVAPGTVDLFWKLYGERFDVDAAGKIAVKDSVKSPSDYVKELLAGEASVFARNPRKEGANPTKPGETGSRVTVDQLLAMSKDERLKAMRENPELLKEFDKAITARR